MGGCESTIGSRAKLLHLDVDKCGNCCGERQCILSCFVLQVCIWHRQAKSSSVFSLPRMLSVEIRPIGADVQAKRTEAGKPRRSLGCQAKRSLHHEEETWIWEPQDACYKRTDCMTFRVPPSGQLGVKVLENPADWWQADATPNVLGEARIRVDDDILSALDAQALSKELLKTAQVRVVSGEMCKGNEDLLQHTRLPRSAGSTGVHGKLCHPLVMDKRVCGEITVELTVSFVDPAAEFQELVSEFSRNPSANAGTTMDFMKICQERSNLNAPPAEDEMWSPRSLNCAATGAGVDGAL